MSEGLLRITAVAGGRRSDLAVPGGVAVADLLPELARAVGLLDPAAVYAGYRLHAHGRRLQPDRGLREQGVDDGALLAVAAGVDDPLALTHDDLVEATAEAVERRRAWAPTATRRTTLAAGLVALGVAIGALAWDVVPRLVAGWSLPVPGGDPGVVAAVVLVLVVLAGQALPALAVAVGVGRGQGVPVDPDLVTALVARSTRVLVVGSGAVAALAALTVPLVADGTAGAVLAVVCALVLLLRARRHRAHTAVLVDAIGGLTVMLVGAVTVLARHPDARSAVAGGILLAGLAACAATGLPGGSTVLRARLLDVLETAVLVALAPLLLLATDGPGRFLGA